MEGTNTITRTIEEITVSARMNMQDMTNRAIALGHDLSEAKQILGHGHFLPWLDSIGISSSTAANFMKVAREVAPGSRLAVMQYSRVLALLAAPAEDREALAEETEGKSAAEIRRLIAERDKAAESCNAETVRADRAEADAKRFYDENSQLNNKISVLQNEVNKQKQYADDLGESFPFSDLYQAMRDGAMTKTSQVSTGEYIQYFEQFLQQGKDIIHLTLSSGISGTVNSAVLAGNDLREKYPDRKIYIIDSLAASSGFGLLMDKLADLRDEGMSIDDLAAWAEEHKLELHHWFFTTDLTYLIRGGRVSKAAGLIGGLLGICPLLWVDGEGKLDARFKIRSKKKVMQKVIEVMEENAIGGIDYADKCYINHSACLEDAKVMASMIEEHFPHLNGKVEIYDVGTTIGSHTGPGTIVVNFWGKKKQ